MTSIEFRAPWGKALRIATLVSVALLALLSLGVLVSGTGGPEVALVVAGLSAAIVLATALCMVRGYTLTEHAIIVRRLGWQTHLPMAGLQSVSGDAAAMNGSLRLMAIGGMFSFAGQFWNRKLGRYRALATDPSRAVVLRYPKRTIVITPHDPQQFIMRARTFLKTAGFPTDR